MANQGSGKSVSKITSPKGTRDLYPEEALKRRYLEQCWRDASVRCGFEEIHGPTFETTDLYAVKSGEGILGELFQAYSGKAPEEVAQVQATGRAPYAMRPEFTPTLARMFAAKAGSLPKPCKWFTGGPYFRAERPQRGRLREFLQWNVDVIGLPGDLGGSGGGLNAEGAEGSAEVAEAKAWMDAEVMECSVALLEDVGLTSESVRLNFNSRLVVESRMNDVGVPAEARAAVLAFLDRSGKLSTDQARREAAELGLDEDDLIRLFERPEVSDYAIIGTSTMLDFIDSVVTASERTAEGGWLKYDPTIVRGLAYYTGTVFEVIADGERAVAGGGRYDKLIELMGGPPTPAVGFAMGDVVVSLLLEDKGLMPQGAELMEAVSRRPASVRPEVFVVGADDESSDALVRRLSADLRRGVEADAYAQAGERKPWSGARYDAASGGVRPMHARVSYKSTRNLKKLLGDGEKQFARLAAIVHGPDRVQLKDFDARKDLTPRDVGLSDVHAEFSVDPASPVYVGRAVERVLA
jgi:histidyl-tRNA synthetase